MLLVRPMRQVVRGQKVLRTTRFIYGLDRGAEYGTPQDQFSEPKHATEDIPTDVPDSHSLRERLVMRIQVTYYFSHQ